MMNRNINYIGTTDSNNGITAKISNDKYIHSANTITVSYNGSIAEAFYQNEPFWATDDVNVLYPKFELNPYIAMFLCTLIYKEKYRFNYGRKWDKEMMQNSKIKLPITSDGSPDWQLMEDYVKSLPYSKSI
jgi:restriction endonuclease S subunit